MTDTVLHWISQYGYFGIYSLLVLGIVGLPVPDETLLTLVGYLSYRGDLHLSAAAAAALLGSASGITLSYGLGRGVGLPLLRRYGHYIHVTEPRIQRVHGWFERLGKWSLLFGYFIPGVRHLIAFIAGTSRLRYPEFALFAYSGSIIWTGTFISIGYFFGPEWTVVLKKVSGHLAVAGGVVLSLIVLYALYRVFRRRRS